MKESLYYNKIIRIVFFFFSSRRRHTRLQGDWSSDVCSSDLKFHEVQKHITVSYHAHLQYAVIVNSKFWAGLPADLRGQLEKAMNEATDYTNEIAVKENEDALKEIKASGRSELHYLTPEQKKAWQVAMQPTRQCAEGRVGKAVIAVMQKSMST